MGFGFNGQITGISGNNAGVLVFNQDILICGLPCIMSRTARATLRDGYWHHVAVTLDEETRSFRYYVNGTFWASPDTSGKPILPARPDGEFYMGATATSCNNAICFNSFYDFSMDEFRLYDRVLSEEEVQATVWAEEVPVGLRESLFLHWGFNDPTGPLEPDLSGRGNDGARGQVGGKYPTLKQTTVDDPGGVLEAMNPPSPIMGCSEGRAPRSIVLAMPGGKAGFSLGLDSFPASLTSMPDSVAASGRLALSGIDGDGSFLTAGSSVNQRELRYHSPEAWPVNTTFPITFAFQTASGESHEVLIYPAPPCSLSDSEVTLDQGAQALIKLEGMCADGRRPAVEILEKPAIGRLYQAVETTLAAAKTYKSFENAEREGLLGPEITDFPAMVTHSRGKCKADGGMQLCHALVNVRLSH